MMKQKRFLIASGGTGGHFYPGFALGKALQEQGAHVLFVVRKQDPSCQVLSAHQLPYQELDLHTGLPRTINPMRHVRFWRQFIKSLSQTSRLIQEFRPDVALGMGGYVSFPLIFCAHRKGVKTAIHESNAIWGLSNKMASLFADQCFLGLPMEHPAKHTVLTSTPIRAEFGLAVNRAEALKGLGLSSERPTVLITGGSQGAKGLNESLVRVIAHFPNWQFIHLTGPRWYETQQRAYTGLNNVKVLAYCEEMYKLMKSADLIICRSGASTVAEVMACQLPALFVPYPHAAANHQYFNAKILADATCAQIYREGPQLAEQLKQALTSLSAEQLQTMRLAYNALNLPSPLQATQTITQLLADL